MASKKAKGKRAKTRYKLKKRHRPLTINRILPDFDIGQSVQIVIDSSVHSGMPFHRYHGFTGSVSGKQGKIFRVKINNHGQVLQLDVHPAHLKPIQTISA